MARGNKNRGRGESRGSYNVFRGRGRGGRGNSRGRGRGGYMPDDFDYPIQQWPSNNPPATPPPRGFRRGRGTGRGRGLVPFNVFHNPNPHRGLMSPRGRGRGRENDRQSLPYGNTRNLDSKLKAGTPLSKLLYEDRPLLRPVAFVRSVQTATLFEREDEIFQPVVETAVDGDEQSHVPTADAVLRIFHHTDNVENFEEEEEQLEEIEFGDIGRIQAEVETAAKQSTVVSEVTSVQKSTTFFVDTTPAFTSRAQQSERIEVDRLEGALGDATLDDDDDEEEEIIVYVAPNPRTGKIAPVPASSPVASASTAYVSSIAGVKNAVETHTEPPDHDNVSLSDEPAAVGTSSQVKKKPSPAFSINLGTLYPEASQVAASPDAEQLPPPPSFDTVSFSFDRTTAKKPRRIYPVGHGTPRSLLNRRRKPRRKSLRGFGSYGAKHEEDMLHQEDPRRDEQRRGDSDVNWGTSDDEDGIEALSLDMGGMEIDQGISLDAMKNFVKSMSIEGSRFVTTDDLADMERLRKEDEEVNLRGPHSADEGEEPASGAETAGRGKDVDNDEEVEGILQAEEEMLMGEANGHMNGADQDQSSDSEVSGNEKREGDDEDDTEDDDADEFSDSEEETLRGSFQARLERLRAQNSGKDKGKGKATVDEDSSDDAMSINITWADEDEEYVEQMERILSFGTRRERKYMFNAIQNGDFDADMFEGMMQPAKRGKNKDVPPELSAQWEKDRQKKAENKQKRALERMILAADPWATHRSGKKARKAMLAAARSPDDLPNRVMDFPTLVQQIRRFLADIGGRRELVLPPADKETRKHLHELANAFNLKSQSRGNGSARYTTLIKTSKSGIHTNERKVARILRQATGDWDAPMARSKAIASLAKHREGEEVGKDAAKIDNKNIGFKMLAAMGWSDGDHIGLSGGLNAPLTAIMKKTKLGLGATL